LTLLRDEHVRNSRSPARIMIKQLAAVSIPVAGRGLEVNRPGRSPKRAGGIVKRLAFGYGAH
jgi:hypothetical protein